MRTAAWILVTLVAVLTLLGSTVSTWVAYSGGQDRLGPDGPSVAELSVSQPEAALHMRARRATSAAYAAGWAVLLLAVAVGPFRRGEPWSFWAILATLAIQSGIVLLRVPLMGHRPGAGAALVQLGLGVVALVLFKLAPAASSAKPSPAP